VKEMSNYNQNDQNDGVSVLKLSKNTFKTSKKFSKLVKSSLIKSN